MQLYVLSWLRLYFCFLLNYFWEFLAFSNICSTPLEVHVYEPWKYIMLNSGNYWHILLFEFFPFKFDYKILTDKDFEFPGWPTIKTGILLIKQIRVTKIFYFNALFMAIFLSFKILKSLEYFICSYSSTFSIVKG
jgi:hypothetical protein